MSAPRLMCIATHHKGGTVWIKSIIRALSRSLSIPWFGIWSDRHMGKVPKAGRAFLCNWHGVFPQSLWDSEDTAFLHVIRDPRDVLLSGCRYHLTAGPKGEKFLHQPRSDLEGRTYQEHLNGLATYAEQLLFEMANKHAETLAEMLRWPWGHPRSTELRYETLMDDVDGAGFAAALGELGLHRDEARVGARIFWDKSLQGGLSKREARPGHVTSGAPRRWMHELPREIGEIYAERHGDALIALGYETDNTWIRQLPETAAA